MIARFIREEEGATAIEYGLIVSLIFLVIVNAVQAFAEATTAKYDQINSAVQSATQGGAP